MMDYMISLMRQFPLLSQEEEQRLLHLVAQGDWEARELLINSNLGLVFSITKKLNGGKWDADQHAEGILGLIHGIEMFDLNLKTRLSTYVTFWIGQSIKKMKSNNSIAPPYHIKSKVKKWNRTKNELHQAFDRTPTNLEINEILQYTKDDLENIQASMLAESEIFDSYVVESSINHDNSDFDPNLFESLNSQEIQIIKMLFGMDEYLEHSFRDVCDILKVSHEHVRKIYNEAKVKMENRVES